MAFTHLNKIHFKKNNKHSVVSLVEVMQGRQFYEFQYQNVILVKKPQKP